MTQVIRKGINIGNLYPVDDPHVDLYIDIIKDGVVVESKKADSLVKGLISGLFSGFGGNNSPSDYFVLGSTGAPFLDGQRKVINAISSTSPVEFTVTLGHGMVTGDHVQIMGVDGNTALNGEWPITVVNSTKFTLDGSVHNGAESIASNPYMRRMLLRNDRVDSLFFRGAEIRLGRSNIATSVNDKVLIDEIPEGSAVQNSVLISNHTVSAVAYGTTVAELTISRDFTNNGTNPLEIREVGLYTWHFTTSINVSGNALMARDITNQTLNIGKTITINYRLRVTALASGGVLATFLELLRRHFISSFAQVKNINGALINALYAPDTYFCAGTGGDSRHSASLATVAGHFLGIVVGRSTADIALTNFKLADKLPHGIRLANWGGMGEPPELWHYGNVVDNYQVDVGLGTATFDVIRIFENKTGAPVTINECGIYCTDEISSQQAPANARIYCIARHKVTPAVVLADGELLKIIYTAKVQV